MGEFTEPSNSSNNQNNFRGKHLYKRTRHPWMGRCVNVARYALPELSFMTWQKETYKSSSNNVTYFSLSWLPVKGFFSRILLNVPIATASFPPNFSEVFVANLERQDLGDIKKSAIEEDHLASFNRKQCGKRILRCLSSGLMTKRAEYLNDMWYPLKNRSKKPICEHWHSKTATSSSMEISDYFSLQNYQGKEKNRQVWYTVP